MVHYWFKKLADALDEECREIVRNMTEDTVYIVEPAVVVLRSIASVLRKVVADA